MSKAILAIEDDPDIAKVLKVHVNSLGYEFEHASDGISGLNLALTRSYQLVILDLGLPKMQGFEVCKAIRKENSALAVLILSSREEELDRVLGLEFGADDYMTKPFSVRELTARIRALLRRSALIDDQKQKLPANNVMQFGELAIDLERRKVTLKDKPVELSAMQFDLIAFLAANPGRPYTKDQLVQYVWGYEISDYDRAVITLIKRIRDRIEPDQSEPRYIKTVRGIGYRFAEASECLD